MGVRKVKSKAGRGRRREPNITKDDIVKYIQKSDQRSANLQRILEDFEATTVARKQIKDILDQLVKDGKVARHKGSRYEARARSVVTGTLIAHRDGYGFVVPREKTPDAQSDIFIPPTQMGSAMNGDKVEVEITLRKSGGRAEGRIVHVTSRGRETIVGQLRYDGEVFFVVPADEKLPQKIHIPDDAAEHKDKMVEVELTSFPTQTRWPVGRIVSVIGFLDDPGVETNVIIKKFGFQTSFSKEVLEEAARLPDALTEADLAGRDDFRQRNTITIDPKTARDFDDAIDVELLKDGSYQLGVHIADVTHFVAPDSAIDTEARIRATSVYFPDRVIPMLPEKVSNHLCSLNPKTDRLAMSVVAHISSDGEVLDYSFHKSVIHSKERMNYDDVQKVLDGDPTLTARYEHLLKDIRTFQKLAVILMKVRERRGSIDFDLPEPMLTYGEEGEVTGIVKSERYFSHRLIEEFMILANEVVARHLENRDIASLYRVHEDPDPTKVMDFAEIVAGFGLLFRPKKAQPIEFQKFIASIAGRPEERMLSYLMLRSFKQAIYSADNAGHFGLASESYTHFTSPIRRYPDLIVHRILKATMGRKAVRGSSEPIPYSQLEAIASESSERERTAAQAERELFDWKKILFLEQHLGETFDGIIIAVWKDGFAVELVDYFVEGFIPLTDIPGDYYQLDPTTRTIIGKKSKKRFRLGDRLPVLVARVDKLFRRSYFVPADLARIPEGKSFSKPTTLARKKRSR
jgi:ribonuclease R